MYKFKIGVYILVVVLALSGCAINNNNENNNNIIDNENEKENNNTEGKDINVKQELNIHSAVLGTLNPLLVNNYVSAQALNLIYDSLIKYDKSLRVTSCLAKSWEVSEDGKVWTLQLQDGVKWHDGESFDSEDVEFTVSLIKSLKDRTPYYKAVQNISSVEYKNNSIIKIYLNKPQFNYIKLLYFPILPAHEMTGMSIDDYAGDEFKPLGTGPYKFTKFVPMKEYQLTRNESWWEDKIPNIKRINVRMIPDNDTVLDALKAKEINIAVTDYVDWEKYASRGEYKIAEYLTSYYDFLAFNFSNEILNDINIRKAIALLIDRDKIISEILLGHGVKTDSPIVPGSYLYDPTIKYSTDSKKAQEFLKNAGWKDIDNDGILEKEVEDSIQELTLRLVTNDENVIRNRVADEISERLKEAGFNIIVHKYSWDNMNNVIYSGDFDLLICGYNLMPTMDVSFAFHSKEIERATNFINYSNEYLDSLFEQAYNTKDINKEKLLYKDIQDVIRNTLPYFSLYFRTSALIYDNNIGGNIQPLYTDIFNNIEEWTINE